MLQGLHQAATAALDPTAEGGGFSTIPAASLTAMETYQVSILAGSTTLEPTAQVQVQHIFLHLLEASVFLPSLTIKSDLCQSKALPTAWTTLHTVTQSTGVLSGAALTWSVCESDRHLCYHCQNQECFIQ